MYLDINTRNFPLIHLSATFSTQFSPHGGGCVTHANNASTVSAQMGFIIVSDRVLPTDSQSLPGRQDY